MPTAAPRACGRCRTAHIGRCAVADMQHDAQRGTAWQRGYNGAWQRARIAFIAEQFSAGNVCCAGCGHPFYGGSKDIELDHRIPHRGDAALFWDTENWQMLCHPCHSRKTMRESVCGRA